MSYHASKSMAGRWEDIAKGEAHHGIPIGGAILRTLSL